MSFVALTAVIAAALFFLLLTVQELGRRFGRTQWRRDPDGWHTGLGAIEGAIFALLGLFVAFTFNGAATRFEARRTLIGQEATATMTAYLRLDLLAPGPRASLQEKFRRYLGERLAAYRSLPDLASAYEHLERSEELQGEIWDELVPAAVAAGPHAPVPVLGATNAMFDIATTRLIAGQAHPPISLYAMLGLMAVLSAFPAGYAMAMRAARPVLYMVVYAAVMALAIAVIVDLEYPRLGLINIDEADRNLVKVLEQMR
jgi:hypothetical protein